MIETQPRRRRGRHIKIIIGLIVLAGVLVHVREPWARKTQPAADASESATSSQRNAAFAALVPLHAHLGESIEERAARDPIHFFEDAVEYYDSAVRDYTCVFTKQERIGGKLGPEQVTNAMFREKPFSVRLEWTRNADKCDRVLYVADRWVENNQQMAVVEPGAVARLFVSHVMRPIHGKDAMRSSRRTIDQFGLRNTLCLALKYAKLSREHGTLDFKYRGKSQVDGRETLLFERRLPYTGEGGEWPDRLLLIHLDKEMLVPTLCLCYADDEQQVLLGKYMTTNIKLNVNLPDSVFTKEGMGL
ncbi:MAG TPA: DUF1571 domain-containing protein [Phycisphaerae bacterium]|mgnify:CR=1 FL=1|nr:DUF1571 domain-containing protein [Phycisphaerae bacterium]HRR87638.1 DUF1571 domain-containing protein [Phycisphaerae bacterium]